MSSIKPVSVNGYRYQQLVGTGGIGSGIFFSMDGDETLGRNESRAAVLEPFRDYCKQHIILHYISVLLGAGANGPFSVYPIGKVGDDTQGHALIRQMQQAGMDTKYVEVTRTAATMFSVCFQYPDRSGGNITTSNSASNEVSEKEIEKYFAEQSSGTAAEIVLAAPEVPLSARLALLKEGKKKKSFTVASFLSAEAEAFIDAGGVQLTDLISINMDEALHIIGEKEGSSEDLVVAEKCVGRLSLLNPAVAVLITNGSKGVFCFLNTRLYEYRGMVVPVVSTAGAGDAFLAGTISGLCAGLPLAGGVHYGTDLLSSAVEFGTLLAAYAVTSPDSIHPQVSADHLFRFALDHKQEMSSAFKQLFTTHEPL